MRAVTLWPAYGAVVSLQAGYDSGSRRAGQLLILICN